MKVIECPRCNGSIELERDAVDQEIYVCDYCGAKIKYTIKSKAAMDARVRVKELEHDEVMADKHYDHEMEVLEKEYEQEERRDANKNKAMLLLAIFSAACLVIGFVSAAVLDYNKKNPGFTLGAEQVQVAKSASQMRDKDHATIESELRGLGFTDIESEGLGDKGGWLDFERDGAIDYISIGGNSDFDKNTWFNKDSKIIIKYHSYPDQ